MALKDVNKVKVILRFTIDATIICAGGITLLMLNTLLLPYERGFFCDDASLKYPFKESTVTSAMLYGIGFALGFLLILGLEAFLIFFAQRQHPGQQKLDITTYGILLVFSRDIYLSIIPFLYGAVIEHIVTDVTKYSIGRLRPHFFDVCSLNLTETWCSTGYIEDFSCISNFGDLTTKVRLSFPSGHASFSMFVAAYLMIYLQLRSAGLVNSLVIALLQASLFSLALWTSLFQVSDYQHHPEDVLAGSFIGIAIAFVVAYYVSDLIKMPDAIYTTTKKYKSLQDVKTLEIPLDPAEATEESAEITVSQ